MKQVALGTAVLLLTLLACSGSSGSSGASGTSSGASGTSGASGGTSGTSGSSGGGSCGLSLAWRSNGAACDAWMGQHCCSQEQACAGDAACAAIVKCVNACPLPRKDACINACGTAPPAGVTTIGTCSKQTPPAVDAAIPACEWP